MQTISRLDPFRGLNSLQDQVNRLFDQFFSSRPFGQIRDGDLGPSSEHL